MVRSKEAHMVEQRGIEVFEGRSTPRPINGEKWIRLLVRRNPRQEDTEAERLLQDFATALEKSDYRDEFLLTIFRIEPDKEPSFGILPKIENKPGCEGIDEVRRYLSTYAHDVKIPLVT
jgi:hypothetical protein